MGTITITIGDAVDDRLREFEWKKYKGKGKHKGEIITQALTEYLDKHEEENRS